MAVMDEPKISVIVATLNRAHAISDCLESISDAFKQADWKNGEIVLVDNGSTDDTQDIARKWSETSFVPLLLATEHKQGLSYARNAGIKNSSGDILLFTDDDCRVNENYIRQALDHFAKDRESGLKTLRSGSVLLGNQDDLPLTIKPIKETKTWKRPLSVEDEGNLLGDSLIGCNMMATREIVDQIGTFDEKLGAGSPCRASEDTDYFYRAYLAGITLQAVPNLTVYHYHGRKTEQDRRKLLENYAIGNGALCLKYLFIYPRFSRHFYWDLKKYLLASAEEKRFEDGGRPSIGRRLRLQLQGVFAYARQFLSFHS